MESDNKQAYSVPDDTEEVDGKEIAWSVGLGIGIGTAVGFATDDLAFWLSIGAAVGAAGWALLMFRR